jgi:hypothetical protein
MTQVETVMGLWSPLFALSVHLLVFRPSARTGTEFRAAAVAATLTKPVTLLFPLAALSVVRWNWKTARITFRSGRA